MDIDESRRDSSPARVDDPCRSGVAQPAHIDDPSAANADIRREPRVAAAIEDAPVADQQLVWRLCLCERRGAEYEQNQRGKDEPYAHGAIFAQTQLRWVTERPHELPGCAMSATSGRPASA